MSEIVLAHPNNIPGDFMIRIVLPAIYLIIILVNLLGLDDKNLILFITSPPFWIIEQYRTVPIWVIYIITITFYSLLGLLIDRLFKVVRKGIKK